MKWKADERQYSSGKVLMLGKWKVGGVYYDSCRSKNDPNKYKTECYLPGLKSSFGHFDEEPKAQSNVEFAVKYWIEKSGILGDNNANNP